MNSSRLAAPSRSLRIFIVENHVDTLKLLSLYLESMGHTVASASSMSEALEAMPQTEFDMLISDIGLPDGNGWELLAKAHLPPTVYAIAMSGFGMNSDRLKSEAAGFRKHMLKPLLPTDLDAALEEAAREVEARK